MKIVLKDLLNSSEALKDLGELDSLNSNISFRIARLLRSAQDIYLNFESIKKKLVERLSDGNTKDGGTIIPVKNRPEFEIEINKLLEEEVEIELPEIKEEHFVDVKFKPKHIASLYWLITE